MSPTTDLQVCTKCHTEKAVSEFHRRGRGYQKICSSCRNAEARNEYRDHGKTPNPRPAFVINPDNFPLLEKRIAALEPKLRASARQFAHDVLTADDIYSEMIEAILTRCRPEDNDFFLMQRAQWTAQAYLAKSLTYNHHVDELEIDEEEAERAGFKVVSSARVTEDEMIVADTYEYLHKVIESLPKEYRHIVVMISIGKNQREIAQRLEVSEQTISERMKIIRATLTATFLSDAQIELTF